MTDEIDLDQRLDGLEIALEEGRFADALALIDGILGRGLDCGLGKEDHAWLHFQRGACLDRLGRATEADAAFRRAGELAPEDFPMPQRLNEDEFDRLVAEALDSLPERFDPYLSQVAVAVRDYPGPSDPDPYLLGLYVGVPRTERTQELTDNLDQIFIFKRNLELDVLDQDELREEIRKTVVHEIAHHFGFGEEDMGEYA